jgi:hypothetical protein
MLSGEAFGAAYHGIIQLSGLSLCRRTSSSQMETIILFSQPECTRRLQLMRDFQTFRKPAAPDLVLSE